MKKLLVIILALAIPFTVAACKGAVDTTADGIPVTMADGTPVTNPDGTPVTVPAELITDSDGQIVTYPGGIPATRPLQVPITDKDGNLVTNADGSLVTENYYVPATDKDGQNITKKDGSNETMVNDKATTTKPTQPMPSQVPTDPIISDDDPVPSDKVDFELPYNCAESGLKIMTISRYDGFFAEDGTNDETKDSLAITVKNVSGQYIDIGNILLTVNGKEDALFQFTYIAPNETVIVQEKNNMKYHSGDTFTFKDSAATFKNNISSGWYTGADIIKVRPETGRDTNVVITNISGKDLKNGYIYFKQKHNGIVQGGITYRISLDELLAGETRHLMAWHFNDDSVIVDVTFSE